MRDGDDLNVLLPLVRDREAGRKLVFSSEVDARMVASRAGLNYGDRSSLTVVPDAHLGGGLGEATGNDTDGGVH